MVGQINPACTAVATIANVIEKTEITMWGEGKTYHIKFVENHLGHGLLGPCIGISCEYVQAKIRYSKFRLRKITEDLPREKGRIEISIKWHRPYGSQKLHKAFGFF